MTCLSVKVVDLVETWKTLRTNAATAWTLQRQSRSSFQNGYFADWTVTSEVKKPDGTLVANLDIVWADPLKTRILHIQKFDTKPWPIGRLLMDVQFVRPDGYTISSNTITLLIEKDVTGGE